MRVLAIFGSSVCLCFCLVLAAAQGRDDRLQRAVDGAMKGRAGAAIVIQVDSGRLVAAHRLDTAARRLVRPGSTIKPLTLLALLEAGLVGPETALLCRRNVRVAGRSLDCSHVAVPEPIDAALALAYSCNYFFVHMAEHLPADTLVRTFREAGLGVPTGWAANEIAGIVQRPATQESLQLMAVGEASVQVTPLGIGAAYRKLALRLRQGEPALRPVLEGLTGATRYGTAQLARPAGLSVAGKTGTAVATERNRTHAWFAGFAPADRPEIVVVVFLEEGSGGADAAPVARRIFEAYR